MIISTVKMMVKSRCGGGEVGDGEVKSKNKRMKEEEEELKRVKRGECSCKT